MGITRQRKNNKENNNKVIGNLVKFEFVIKVNNFYIFMLYLEKYTNNLSKKDIYYREVLYLGNTIYN